MKKGFTLVELLAVIAILAILVIIALPNVMGMFNQAKRNSFITEIKEIFKVAEQKWMSDSMFNTKEISYGRNNNESCDNTLDLSGRQELEYYIKINKSGDVVSYKASDGTYQYVYDGPGLKIEDIKDVAQVSELESNQVIGISCDGENADPDKLNGTFYVYNERGGSEIGATLDYDKRRVWCEADFRCALGSYSETKEDCEAYGNTCLQMDLYFDTNLGTFNSEKIPDYRPYYIMIKVKNNVVKEASVCFTTDKDYCLKGGDDGDSYSQNLAIVQAHQSLFVRCDLKDVGIACFHSDNSNLSNLIAYKAGYVNAGNAYGASCSVNSDKSFYCMD